MSEDTTEALDTSSQPSDGTKHSQLTHNTSPEINNLTLETEAGSNLDKDLKEHLEVFTEESGKENEFIGKGPEDTRGSEKTAEKQLHYSYNADLILKSIYQETDVSVNPSSVMLLTNGFISHFLPPLLKAQSSINQIRSSQSVLLETVQQESSKFIDCQAFTDLKDTMTKAKQYHNKLLKLRREMTDLHEKSKRLKKRALKLQQQRQKEELTRAHNLEKELEKERMLTARVASTQD
ncbi:hypothetical protein BsWGS_16627 [Bradybaena similaris]